MLRRYFLRQPVIVRRHTGFYSWKRSASRREWWEETRGYSMVVLFQTGSSCHEAPRSPSTTGAPVLLSWPWLRSGLSRNKERSRIKDVRYKPCNINEQTIWSTTHVQWLRCIFRALSVELEGRPKKASYTLSCSMGTRFRSWGTVALTFYKWVLKI